MQRLHKPAPHHFLRNSERHLPAPFPPRLYYNSPKPIIILVEGLMYKNEYEVYKECAKKH